MMTKSKLPKIRFSGFTEKWEEGKLFDLGTFNPKSEIPEKFEYVDLESVVGTKMISHRMENKSTAPSRAQRVALQGDLFYQTVRPYQRNNYLFNLYYNNYVFSTGYAQIRPSENGNFLLSLVQNDRFVKDVLNNCTGTSYPAINSKDLANIDIHYPELDEQTKIGNYFQQLDKLIEQKEKRYQKLRQFKKAMLDKMFPKNGADTPEIRFKDFSGKWKEKNWSETVDISTKMVDPKTKQFDELLHVGPGNIESFSGRIYNNVLKVKDSSLISGKFLFKKGDVIYGKINPQLAKYIIAPFDGLASADAYVLNTKNGLAQNYLFLILQSKSFYKYSVSVSTRTGMPKINRNELGVYDFLAPNILEQDKIGGYFQKLDKQMDLQFLEIEKLKNIKKASLDKMFV